MLFFIALCCLHLCALSQPKTLSAVKALHAPVIDGDLNDAAWQQAPAANDFIQNFPEFGKPATVRSVVKILYDNNAIYIGAYLYDDPALIRKQITARDGEQRQDVDYFSVFFDTYNDQQNGFQFLVTSANVQSDARIGGTATSSGMGQFGDDTWDAVWQSQVQMKKDGWVVEMRIPYLSLRFSKKDVQTWGLQFLRFIRRDNESSYWNPVNPSVNGFANQFGKYANLMSIEPPLRLSFSPYLSTGIRVNPQGSDIKSQWLRNGGMDVKYGVNESFTLDATLIPDFGQVVSDNIINNLSPFEVRFQENRPFFTEGTELFNKSGLFYSRRIGNTPGGYYAVQNLVQINPDYQLIKNPSVTQLYNGIKFSGRTKKKLGIGIFNAVTAPITAELRNVSSKQDTLILTEPLSNYNIIVLDQALKGQSSVTFTNTNVIREGSARNANVSAFDWSLFNHNSEYQFKGTMRYSKVFGYTPYNGEINLIEDTITRNKQLYVKPYSGFNTSVQLGKVSGTLQYYLGNSITSNKYDPNDLGYLQFPDNVNYIGGISYNQFKPTKNLINYRYSFDVNTQYFYKPYKFSEMELNASAYWIFKNFWDVTITANAYPFWQNDFFELRTAGRYLRRPPEATFGINGSTDSRKPWYFSYNLGYAVRSISNNSYNNFEFGFRYRFSNQLTLSADVTRQYENNQIGYAFVRETNGDPIVGYRNFTETIGMVSGIYNFTSRLNITLRGRHYWNRVNYNSYYNIDMDGKLTPKPSTFQPSLNDNYNVFNLDAFLTWDFRLGSRVIVGWKNWLGDPYAISGVDYRHYTNNLGQTFAAAHGNELTVKVIYFLDYNQLKHR